MTILCPSCGSPDLSPFLDRPNHPVSVFWRDYASIPEVRGRFDHCPGCDHVFLVSAYDDPNYAEAAARLYACYELLAPEVRPFPQRDLHYKGAVEFLGNHLNLAGNLNVLEIGSNRGDFLYLLKEAAPGFNILGIEPSNLPFQGVPTIRGFFDETRIGGSFDLIVSRHVLEHIRDPHDFLVRAVTLLNANGRVYLEVPNMHFDVQNRIECFIPEHIHHFSERSLACLLERAGLEILTLDSGKPEGLRLISGKLRRSNNLDDFAGIGTEALAAYTADMEAVVEKFVTLLKAGKRPTFYGFGNIFLDVLSEILKRIPMTELLNKGAVILDDTPSKIGRTFRGMSILSPAEGLAGSECAVMVCTMNPTHRGNMRAKVLDMAPGTEVLTPWEIGHD